MSSRLTFQDALFQGYKQFCFRKKVQDLTEENYQHCRRQQRKEDERDMLFLVDPEVTSEMRLVPEEIIYIATEELHGGSYQGVIESEAFKKWKAETERFLQSVREITTTYNVTNIELV